MDIKKKTKFVTFVIIPIFVVLILGYDVYAILEGGTEASISSLVITSAYKMPFMVAMICLFLGILIGHLFWRMRGNKDTRELDNPHENSEN
jgi:hypothetical protein